MSGSIESTDARDHKQTGFWSAFRFEVILTPREKCSKRTGGRCVQTNAETSKVAGVISRRNTAPSKWAGSCSAEMRLGVKMKHKVGVSQCHFVKGTSQHEQAFWMACWLILYESSGATLCPALGPFIPKRCGTIGKSLEGVFEYKQWFSDSAYKGR